MKHERQTTDSLWKLPGKPGLLSLTDWELLSLFTDDIALGMSCDDFSDEGDWYPLPARDMKRTPGKIGSSQRPGEFLFILGADPVETAVRAMDRKVGQSSTQRIVRHVITDRLDCLRRRRPNDSAKLTKRRPRPRWRCSDIPLDINNLFVHIFQCLYTPSYRAWLVSWRASSDSRRFSHSSS